MSTPMEVDPPAATAKPSKDGKDKPRFEVKKVPLHILRRNMTDSAIVERSCFVGMGYDRLSLEITDLCRYRRRQLCYLSKSHHGSLCVILESIAYSRYRMSSKSGKCYQ